MVSSIAPSLIDLRKLRLGDAHALLEHSGATGLPALETSPADHVQYIIDGLCELSLKDPLTNLANRRHFHAVLQREIDVVARSGESALLLMLDIDHFKKINDSYGHLAGDHVIQTVARSLAKCVRPMDTVARYGGEEFAVVLPNCQASFGATVAERIRQTVESLCIAVTPTVDLRVTISIGGAFAPEWVRSTTALWTERADTQLYRAKTEGRNRVCLDHQPILAVSAEEKSLLFGPLSAGEPAWIENTFGDASGNAMNKVN